MSRRWVVVALIFLGIMISYVDRAILGIAAPSIMKEFAFDPAAMGMLLSAFFWTYALFQIPAGTFVDRFGIREVICGGVLPVVHRISGHRTEPTASVRFSACACFSAWPKQWDPSRACRSFGAISRATKWACPPPSTFAGQNLGPAAGTLLGTLLIAGYGWRAMFRGHRPRGAALAAGLAHAGTGVAK